MAKTFTQFGPDPAFSELPAEFQSALISSNSGASTADTDATVGSLASGHGFCSQKPYMQTTYCACVNAPVGASECVFAPCTNAADSYKTTSMQAVLADAATQCPQAVNCIQTFDMGGSGNVASHVQMTQNCNSTTSQFIEPLAAHPFIAVVAIVLVCAIALLVAGPPAATFAAALPPPATVFSNIWTGAV